MLVRKGYNLIMWTTTLALILAFMAFMQPILKRTLAGKIKQSSNYTLWQWIGAGDCGAECDPQTALQEENTRVRTKSYQELDSAGHESREGIMKSLQNQTKADVSVSWSIEKGSEPYLNTIDGNIFSEYEKVQPK